MCKERQKARFFDAIQQNNIQYVQSKLSRLKFSRETRRIETEGFTGLLYSIYYNKPEAARLLLPELSLRTTQLLKLNINNELVELQPNSSALHLAIVLNNVQITRIILNYIKQLKGQQRELTSDLQQPNSANESNLHFFCINTKSEMKQLLFETKLQFGIQEFKLRPNCFMDCVSCLNVETLEYVLTFCKFYSYKEVIKECFQSNTRAIYGQINNMLTNDALDQQKLKQIIALLAEYTYERYPDLSDLSNKYLPNNSVLTFIQMPIVPHIIDDNFHNCQNTGQTKNIDIMEGFDVRGSFVRTSCDKQEPKHSNLSQSQLQPVLTRADNTAQLAVQKKVEEVEDQTSKVSCYTANEPKVIKGLDSETLE